MMISSFFPPTGHPPPPPTGTNRQKKITHQKPIYMSRAWLTPALEVVGKGKFPEVRTQGPPGTITGKRAVSLLGFHPNAPRKSKSPRAANDNVRDGYGVGTLSVSAPLKSHIPKNGVGGIELSFVVLTGQDILSRPARRARRAIRLPVGDASNQGDCKEGWLHTLAPTE